MKPNQVAQKQANKKENEKLVDALFHEPPKSKGKPLMADKLTELQQKIEALQKERDDLMATERFEAIENINMMIRTYGIRSRDLNFGEVSKPVFSGKSKKIVKYKLGHQTWSGLGRKPKWVEDHVTTGGKLEELLAK